MWVMPELIEAAARTGDTELARDALERLAKTTQPCGNEFALGMEARSRALLSEGETADELYREAIEQAEPDRHCVPSSPERTCSTESGYAARIAGPTRELSCAWPTRCSPRSAWRHSPSAHALSFRLTGEKVRKRYGRDA